MLFEISRSPVRYRSSSLFLFWKQTSLVEKNIDNWGPLGCIFSPGKRWGFQGRFGGVSWIQGLLLLLLLMLYHAYLESLETKGVSRGEGEFLEIEKPSIFRGPRRPRRQGLSLFRLFRLFASTWKSLCKQLRSVSTLQRWYYRNIPRKHCDIFLFSPNPERWRICVYQVVVHNQTKHGTVFQPHGFILWKRFPLPLANNIFPSKPCKFCRCFHHLSSLLDYDPLRNHGSLGGPSSQKVASWGNVGMMIGMSGWDLWPCMEHTITFLGLEMENEIGCHCF